MLVELKHKDYLKLSPLKISMKMTHFLGKTDVSK